MASRHNCPVVVDLPIPFHANEEIPIELPSFKHLPHEGALLAVLTLC